MVTAVEKPAAPVECDFFSCDKLLLKDFISIFKIKFSSFFLMLCSFSLQGSAK